VCECSEWRGWMWKRLIVARVFMCVLHQPSGTNNNSITNSKEWKGNYFFIPIYLNFHRFWELLIDMDMSYGWGIQCKT
jgi:hypothetical protein